MRTIILGRGNTRVEIADKHAIFGTKRCFSTQKHDVGLDHLEDNMLYSWTSAALASEPGA